MLIFYEERVPNVSSPSMQSSWRQKTDVVASEIFKAAKEAAYVRAYVTSTDVTLLWDTENKAFALHETLPGYPPTFKLVKLVTVKGARQWMAAKERKEKANAPP